MRLTAHGCPRFLVQDSHCLAGGIGRSRGNQPGQPGSHYYDVGSDLLASMICVTIFRRHAYMLAAGRVTGLVSCL
ncbi:hypothetical protein ACX800_06075 [Paenarthrobacter nitroguajacolicus]|uniref:hypothetical protein n=1 Tax=Paenarthrobacter nitroguajacolicus TaxID=211146 RepID=UPI003D21514A